MRKIAVVLAVVAAVAIGIIAYPEPDPFPAVPLPELGDGPITLRVVRALSDRWSKLSEPEFEEVLAQPPSWFNSISAWKCGLNVERITIFGE